MADNVRKKPDFVSKNSFNSLSISDDEELISSVSVSASVFASDSESAASATAATPNLASLSASISVSALDQAVTLLQTQVFEEENEQIGSILVCIVKQLYNIQEFKNKTSDILTDKTKILEKKVSLLEKKLETLTVFQSEKNKEFTSSCSFPSASVKESSSTASFTTSKKKRIIVNSSSPSAITTSISYADTLKEGLQQKSSETSEKKSHKSEIKISSFNQKQKLSVSVLSQRARQQILPEIDCFKVRNLINDCFKTNKITEKSVILAVKVSFSGLSVVLTTTNDFSSEYLKTNKDI